MFDQEKFFARHLPVPVKPGCLEWSGRRFKKNYGKCGYLGKETYVHRVAYLVTFGPPPPDKPNILHRCDNPPCFLPEHLYAGTPQRNVDDMFERGRSPNGSRIEERVNRTEFEEIWAEGMYVPEICKKFGISSTSFWKLFKLWELPRRNRWTTLELKTRIQELYESGYNMYQISQAMGIPYPTVRYHCGRSI